MECNEALAAAILSDMCIWGIDENTVAVMFDKLSSAQGEARAAGEVIASDHYEGQTKNGQAHGNGKMNWANGDKYEGSFSKGKPHGKGVYTFASGRVYIGEFAEGKRNG